MNQPNGLADSSSVQSAVKKRGVYAAVLALAAIGAYVLLKPRTAESQDWYKNYLDSPEVKKANQKKPGSVQPGFQMYASSNAGGGDSSECKISVFLLNGTLGQVDQLSGRVQIDLKLGRGRPGESSIVKGFSYQSVPSGGVVWSDVSYSRHDKSVYSPQCEDIDHVSLLSIDGCKVNRTNIEGCEEIVSLMREENSRVDFRNGFLFKK